MDALVHMRVGFLRKVYRLLLSAFLLPLHPLPGSSRPNNSNEEAVGRFVFEWAALFLEQRRRGNGDRVRARIRI